MRIDRNIHMLACYHEAGHAFFLHRYGFRVLSSSVLAVGSKCRGNAGITSCKPMPGYDPVFAAAVLCAGYAAELEFCYEENISVDNLQKLAQFDQSDEIDQALALVRGDLGISVCLLMLEFLSDKTCEAIYTLSLALSVYGEMDGKEVAALLAELGF
jgi:hypothetical protein